MQTSQNIQPPLPLAVLAAQRAAKSRRTQSVEQAVLTAREVDALANGARLIPLTQGKWAIVDAVEHDLLIAHIWYARRSKGQWYAERKVWDYSSGRRIGKTFRMHRIVAKHDGIVDHKDGDGLNNRISNLRPASTFENQRNRGANQNCASGFKGVYLDKRRQKFVAEITVGWKKKFLGNFATPIDAAKAYDAAAMRLHGEFAKTNAMMFPEKFANA